MISYLDTSVILPALVPLHPQHTICRDTLIDCADKGAITISTNHVVAELYGNLTRLPKQVRLSPKDAHALITDLLENRLTFTVDLQTQDYLPAVARCAERNLVSGVIYDALHLQAAIKAEATHFYTANYRDFIRLWDEASTMQLIRVYP